jgi:hypothetical protein
MYGHQDRLRSALSEETLSLVGISAIETSSIKTSILRTGENLVDVEARTVSFHYSIFRHTAVFIFKVGPIQLAVINSSVY